MPSPNEGTDEYSAKRIWFDIPEGAVVTCPDCGESSSEKEWDDTEVGCEDCGSHAAIRCPKCGETFDHVYGPEMFEGKIFKGPA